MGRSGSWALYLCGYPTYLWVLGGGRHTHPETVFEEVLAASPSWILWAECHSPLRGSLFPSLLSLVRATGTQESWTCFVACSEPQGYPGSTELHLPLLSSSGGVALTSARCHLTVLYGV